VVDVLEVGLLLGPLHGGAPFADLQEGGLLLVDVSEIINLIEKKQVEKPKWSK